MVPMTDPQIERLELIEYLSGNDPGVRQHLEGLDQDALTRACVVALAANGDQLRQLLGVEIAKQLLQGAAATLAKGSDLAGDGCDGCGSSE
jgi:hypothetical protein